MSLHEKGLPTLGEVLAGLASWADLTPMESDEPERAAEDMAKAAKYAEWAAKA